MDFSRLAITEVRRNPTRTAVAIAACALAAMIVILLRVVPEGYSVGLAMPERTYSGGDIVIFPAQAPLSSSETNMLIWRSWHGSDWQSHLLYYFPGTGTEGYLAEEQCAGWRGMVPGNIIELVESIPNVKRVSAYRSLPCIITVDGRQASAILRGFDLDGYPIDDYLDEDREKVPAFSQDNAWEVIVPAKLKAFAKLKIDDMVSILVPKPETVQFGSLGGDQALQLGIDWDEAIQYRFTVSQKYAIQVGEEVDVEAGIGSPGPAPSIPIYWERPELLVPMGVFEEIVQQLNPNPGIEGTGEFSLGFPSYQVAVTVDRISKLRETTRLIREALGSDYGVYAVPEARTYVSRPGSHVVMPPDLHVVYSALIIGFASVVVAGNIYIIVVQQKRKLGLLRVVGATSVNIIQYILSLVAYVSAVGSFSGIIAGNILYLITLLGTDLSIKEWFTQALGDCGIIMGLSIGLSLAIGFGIAWWASRLSCSEVLSRE